MVQDSIDGLFGITNKDRQLGIAMNRGSLSSPNINKIKKKRGRKSVVELRSLAGNAGNQRKLADIMHIGKGKCLPQDQ